MKNSTKYSIGFTILSILLSLGLLLASFFNEDITVIYSPELAVLTATLIAVIWYTAYTYEILNHQNTQNQKEIEGLSTALLSELNFIFNLLDDLAQRGNLSNTYTPNPIPKPVLQIAVNKAYLFSSSTVNKITYVHRALIHLDHQRAHNGKDLDTLRNIATMACIGINKLVPDLVSNGGSMPEPIVKEILSTEEIPRVIPINPFRDVKEVDLTIKADK